MNTGHQGQYSSVMTATPASSRAIIATCVVLYITGFLLPKSNILSAVSAPRNFCLLPFLIISSPVQTYRLVSSAFFHGSFLHIVFNMVSLQSCGMMLERQLGSTLFLYLNMLFVILSGLLTFIVALLGLPFGFTAFASQCAIGYSGVIFALVTIQALTRGSEELSVMGMFSVPAHYYPFAMLVINQILLANVSFVGHLGGVLVGFCYHWGFLGWLFPSQETVRSWESWGHLRKISSLDCFVDCPSSLSIPSANQTNRAAIADSISSILQSIRATARDARQQLSASLGQQEYELANVDEDIESGRAETPGDDRLLSDESGQDVSRTGPISSQSSGQTKKPVFPGKGRSLRAEAPSGSGQASNPSQSTTSSAMLGPTIARLE